MTPRRLADLAWTDVAVHAGTTVLAVPVGSTEQHGPHLPLGTDTAVALELADRLAAARPDTLVAPPWSYGSSGEHAGFAGTVSIGTRALCDALVELGRSADAFAGVVFVSAHGGNTEALGSATAKLTAEGRRARWWGPPLVKVRGRADAHAGFTETSVVMALTGSDIRGPVGCTAPIRELMPSLVSAGVAAVSPNGVLGDPSGASPSAGRRILDAWAADLVASLAGWPA
ncbi:MAG TPA: mycofactocin biosynthesis peptidyl-dipeptidase MftE [Acidimicrobiales bacterium]|nr:mycofactocin biosynthesis peptidyl-dipeptidase MftE [Acidimicrobiales bacterium]